MNNRYSEMIIWGFVQLVFCLLTSALYTSSYNNDKRLFVTLKKKLIFIVYGSDIFITTILIIVAGIRCNSGSDYFNYYKQYQNILLWYSSIKDLLSQRFQSGFSLVAYLTRKYIGGDNTIFLIVAILSYIPLTHCIRKYAPYPSKSLACWLLLGYFSMTMNIVKQSFAMVFVMLGYFAYSQKKYIRFVLYAFLALFFHSASLYIIIVIAISRLFNPSRKLYYNMVAVGIFSLIFITPLLELISRFLPDRYQLYVNSFLNNNSGDLKLHIGGIVVSIFYLVVIRLVILYLNRYFEKDSLYYPMVTIAIFCIPFLLFGIRYYVANRVAYFGLQFMIFIIPSFIEQYSISSHNKQLTKSIFTFFLIIFSFCFSILCAENNYYNYSTIFNDTPMSVIDFAKLKQY